MSLAFTECPVNIPSLSAAQFADLTRTEAEALIQQRNQHFASQVEHAAQARRIVFMLHERNAFRALGFNTQEAFAQQKLGIKRWYLNTLINATRAEQGMFAEIERRKNTDRAVEMCAIAHMNTMRESVLRVFAAICSNGDRVDVFMAAWKQAKLQCAAKPKVTAKLVKRVACERGLLTKEDVTHQQNQESDSTPIAKAAIHFNQTDSVFRLTFKDLCKTDIYLQELLEEAGLDAVMACVSAMQKKDSNDSTTVFFSETSQNTSFDPNTAQVGLEYMDTLSDHEDKDAQDEPDSEEAEPVTAEDTSLPEPVLRLTSIEVTEPPAFVRVMPDLILPVGALLFHPKSPRRYRIDTSANGDYMASAYSEIGGWADSTPKRRNFFNGWHWLNAPVEMAQKGVAA